MKSNTVIVSAESPEIRKQFVTQSRAKSWSSLSWDVRDTIVDRWHHPLIVQLTLANGTCLTTLQLLLDPRLLNPRMNQQSRRNVFELCQWLRNNGVRFDLGFAPLLHEAKQNNSAKGIDAHQIFLEIK